jgi:hypothetical protein
MGVKQEQPMGWLPENKRPTRGLRSPSANRLEETDRLFNGEVFALEYFAENALHPLNILLPLLHFKQLLANQGAPTPSLVCVFLGIQYQPYLCDGEASGLGTLDKEQLLKNVSRVAALRVD